MTNNIRLKYAARKNWPNAKQTVVFKPEYIKKLNLLMKRVEDLNKKNPNETGESKDLVEKTIKSINTYIKESAGLRQRHQPVYGASQLDGSLGVSEISRWTHISPLERLICKAASSIANAFQYGTMEDLLVWTIEEAEKALQDAEILL